MTSLRVFTLSVLFIFTCANLFAADLWRLAQQNKDIHRYSTIFIASVVRDQLRNEEGLNQAIQFCKETGITRAFIETYRDGYTAERDALENARDHFREAGIEPTGCVTPTGLGAKSTGWDAVSNYEAQDTRDDIKRVFEFTASMFDEIMIDDFLFTDDESEISKKAKGERSWGAYRNELMLEISRDYVIKPARAVNPDVKLIIKYPQWYDNFHNRGYDVVKQTELFDKIWVGTETRDPDNERWGRKAQFEAFFIMGWLTEIGGGKCGGGWFDTYGTSPATYVEQARQTILGGAKESMLFHYGELQKRPELVEALRAEMEGLFSLARMITGAKPMGALAVKVPNSEPRGDSFIYDFIGMLGVPMAPSPGLLIDTPVTVLAASSWSDRLPDALEKFQRDEKSVVVTSNLAHLLKEKNVEYPNEWYVLEIPKEPRDLYQLPEDELNQYRDAATKRFFTIRGPSRVATYMYTNDVVVVESFNDEEVELTLDIKNELPEITTQLALPKMGSARIEIENERKKIRFTLGPRSMMAIGR